MKIGILGGTGNIGRGLTVRWALKHDILIGSRTLEKARETARGLEKIARGFYQSEMKGSITGMLNADAMKESEVIVVTLPPEGVVPSIVELRQYLHANQVVVSTVVAMKKRRGLFHCTTISAKELGLSGDLSAAQVVQSLVEPTPVVSAFQTVPAAYLSNIDSVLNLDVLIAGDDELAVNIVSKLVRDIPNLRPLRVGPLENSKWIESITPLLLNAAVLNNLQEPSLRVVPWMPASYTE